MVQYSRSNLFISSYLLLSLVVLSVVAFVTQNFMIYLSANILLATLIVYLSKIVEKNKMLFVVTFIIASFVYSVFWNIITCFSSALTWDLKAQENIASYILMYGHIPTPLSGIYRIEYTSYPAAYILMAILSEFTFLPIYILMKMPILTTTLYVLLLWVMLDMLYRVNKKFYLVIIALLIIFVIRYQLVLIFIYQNFGRVLLLFLIYLIFREIIRRERLDLKTLLIATIIVFTLVFSHSESAIGLLVITIGFLIEGIVKRGVRSGIITLFIVILIAFCLYHVWYITEFTSTLTKMLITILNHFLMEEEVIMSSFKKYTPLDYTLLELALYVISLISLLTTSLISFTLGILRFFRKKELMWYPGPLVLIGASFVFLFWFSPYKSDISLKFLPALSIITTISFIELSEEKILNNETKSSNRFLNILLLLLAIVLILGSLIIGNKGLFSNVNVVYNEFAMRMESTNFIQVQVLSTINKYHIAILDSPELPFYFIRDYISPRLMTLYDILIAEPHTEYYNYFMINGLKMPRFILFQHTAVSSFNEALTTNWDLIIGSESQLTKLKGVNTIYNDGILCIGVPS